jgi:hypothetical protein
MLGCWPARQWPSSERQPGTHATAVCTLAQLRTTIEQQGLQSLSVIVVGDVLQGVAGQPIQSSHSVKPDHHLSLEGTGVWPAGGCCSSRPTQRGVW